MEKKVHLGTGFDRFSSLPDPIRAHILSYLPTRDVVRTSILSNAWRELWTQVPSLDLSKSELPKCFYVYEYGSDDVAMRARHESVSRCRGLFFDFLDRAFESILMLEKLKLYVPGYGLELKSRLDSWLDRALGYRLVELEIDLGVYALVPWTEIWYSLPKRVFSSNLITKLCLAGCEVNATSLTDIHLPSLCNLSLVGVFISGEVIGGLFANCPNLEDFHFDNCHVLERLEISGLVKLKKARIKYCYDEPLAIEIRAPSLLELIYECGQFRDKEGFCEIELYDCTNMKKFIAVGTALDDEHLHSLLENLPALERLQLYYCDCLRCIVISSPNLTDLELMQCQWLRKAEVTAPKLKVFHYINDNPILLPLKGLTPKLKKATVYIQPGFKSDKWYADLVKFLAKLRHCEQLVLSVGYKEDLIISQEVRKKTRPPLSGVKYLMVTLRESWSRTPVSCIEGLLWLAPSPEIILIFNCHTQVHKSLEFRYETPLKSQKKCGCWKSLPTNCWRHSLNKVTIENKKGAEDDTKLANFFRNGRIDGKIVECSYPTPPSGPEKNPSSKGIYKGKSKFVESQNTHQKLALNLAREWGF